MAASDLTSYGNNVDLYRKRHILTLRQNWTSDAGGKIQNSPNYPILKHHIYKYVHILI